MPDIIEQLEAGKKLQEDGEIDAKSLRTKINPEEELAEESKPKSKRKRKKKEQQTESKEDKETSPDLEDPFEQAEKIINESLEPKEDSNIEKPKEKKKQKYPGFDFNDYYVVGQKIFYIRVLEKIGVKDLLELKIRTVYPDMIVACEKKGFARCIGPETQDMIFLDRHSAEKAFDNIAIKVFKDVNPKDELGNIEISDTED